MFLRRSVSPARALITAALAAVVSACGDGPGPGPTPSEVRITAVSPNSGTTFGGTTITITGSGFAAGASVLVGGTPAVEVVATNSTTIIAKTPAHAAGAAEVRVSIAAKSATLPNAFTFVRPVVGANTPPVVGALTVQPPRTNQPRTLATVGDRFTLSATVSDAETPVSGLTFVWTANPTLGTFEGNGALVHWTAPSTAASPQLVELLLTVIERYQEPDPQGLPINREHRIQQSALVRVHDSIREIGEMARDFLLLFSDSNKKPVEVLHNFSQTCDGGRGYTEEFNDVVKHRDEVTVVDSFVGQASVTLSFSAPQACPFRTGPGDACATVPVRWVDRNKSTGALGGAQGTDYVSAVFETNRWRLCHSSFEGVSLLTGQRITR